MRVIVNADDFGMSRTVNQAISEGYKNGILTSTCIMANMPAFEDAMRRLQDMVGIGFGVHLNIIEYKTILENKENKSKLYDKNGTFKNGFLQMLLKSKDEDFLFEIEHEFREQIEAVMSYNVQPDHLDSHVHVHAIPAIFNIVCKLAKEYGIPCVRTQHEHLYFAGDFKTWLKPQTYINLIKVAILNFFTMKNKKTAQEYGLVTNDNVIGVGYTSMMNEDTIFYGVNALKKKRGILEVICHPDTNEKRPSNVTEYKAVTSPALAAKLGDFERMSFGEFLD